jgi:hypothetical protein
VRIDFEVNMVNLSRIEHQAVDGMVVTRIFNELDELLLEYNITPMDAINLAQSQMTKAAEAVTQEIPINGRHAKVED